MRLLTIFNLKYVSGKDPDPQERGQDERDRNSQEEGSQ